MFKNRSFKDLTSNEIKDLMKIYYHDADIERRSDFKLDPSLRVNIVKK